MNNRSSHRPDIKPGVLVRSRYAAGWFARIIEVEKRKDTSPLVTVETLCTADGSPTGSDTTPDGWSSWMNFPRGMPPSASNRTGRRPTIAGTCRSGSDRGAANPPDPVTKTREVPLGLSDEERINKVVWAVNALASNGRKLRKLVESKDYDDIPYGSSEEAAALVGYLDQVWHAYLGAGSNGMFWIIGGDHNNPVEKPGAPWSTAIIAQCERNRPLPADTVSWDELAGKQPFDPFDNFLDVRGLLPLDYHKLIFDTYAWTEQLVYALRRYRDKLLAGFPALDKLISDIQGCCFDLFQKQEAFGRAYVGSRLLKALYETDPRVKEIFLELCFHHDLGPGIREGRLKDVIAWDHWRLDHKATPQNAIVLALRISGRRFKHAHKLRQIIEKTRGMGVREKVLQREFDKCLKASQEEEESSRKRYSQNRDWDALEAIHGYGSHLDAWLKGEE